jgi:DNA polymerase I-like protein with 3'-5' exonuclease and polymerase domains
MSQPSELRTLVFDLEANGLLKQATKVHCIAICDATTGDVWSYGPEDIERGLEELYDADVLVAHNGSTYDIPLLRKLYGWNPRPGSRLIDTLVVARLLHPNVKEDDFKRIDWDKKLIGSHSLRAWGLRLGCPKDDYDGGWEEWSQTMQDYCERDVLVTYRLLTFLRPWEYPSQVPLDLEHQVAHICHLMQEEGWTFDKKAAQKLYVQLVQRKDEIESQLIQKFGQWEEVDKVLIPKRDNKKLGYTAGVPVTKMKTVVFNPGSRVHIEKKLKEAGWEPTEYTDSGRAKLDESVLGRIKHPEAELLVEYLLIQKRLSQISDGTNGWLRLVETDGRIHGAINTGGTVTGRATHHSPNVSQVPANRAIYGKECRSCFTVPEGWKLVGADMAGLELRTFAHYLAAFDQGEYAKIVTEGDVHTHNQLTAGLETRDQAKTFIYALLYGAGAQKIGQIVGGTEKEGNRLKHKFMSGMPAYSKLKAAVDASCTKGWIKGLDGRRLHIRSTHAALNTLLQGAGAILCKQWLVSFFNYMTNSGYTHGYEGDFVIVGWIHDEIQVATKEEYTEVVGNALVHCAKKAGEPYDFTVPLDSSYSIGNNWSETH